MIDGLAEMSIGDWEGKKFTELYGQYKLLERCNGDLTWRPPNGESLDDVAQRMASASSILWPLIMRETPCWW